MSFSDHKFDLVICSNLLHRISDYLSVVTVIKRIFKRYIVISESNRYNSPMFAFGSIKSDEKDNV